MLHYIPLPICRALKFKPLKLGYKVIKVLCLEVFEDRLFLTSNVQANFSSTKVL
jgi:hypothetical protein